MKTKQDIIDEVLSSRLTANDIHLFSERMIPMTQCHDLLRSGKMSVPTALLLRGYAARVGSDSVDDSKKSLGTLITLDIEQMAATRGDCDRTALEPFDGTKNSVVSLGETGQDFRSTDSVLKVTKEKKADSQKIPPKTHILLTSTGFPSWGADKTYKFVGTMLKVNFDGMGYNALGVTKLCDGFIIDGTPYPVSEFTKVG